MKLLISSLTASLLALAAISVRADVPANGANVGTDTIRDFFVAHKDAKVITQTPHQKQFGTIDSIGQDHFCEKSSGGTVWCIPFSHIVYYSYDNGSVVISFEHPY